MKRNTLESILARVDRSSTCWVWQGQTHDGYGYVSWGGRRKRVHRLVFELLRGPVGPALHLDHLCRNRACCNPDHLDPVTPSVNLARSPIIGWSNGRKAQTHCAHGHEFTVENTYVTPAGARHCRRCAADEQARYQRRRGKQYGPCGECGHVLNLSGMSRHIRRMHADKLIDPEQVA